MPICGPQNKIIIKNKIGTLFENSDIYISTIDEINSIGHYNKKRHLLFFGLLADFITPADIKNLINESYDNLKKRFEKYV